MGKHTCFICEGTGKYKKPDDEEKFDARFDVYAEFLSMGEAREKALKDAGFTIVICPRCGGTGTEED